MNINVPTGKRILVAGTFLSFLLAVRVMALPIEDSWLERTTVPEEQLSREAQAFLLKRLPPLEIPDTREAWETQAAALRRSLLDTVFLEHVPDAWLPAELTSPGTPVRIGYFDRLIEAVVAEEPLFDPTMSRLRG